MIRGWSATSGLTASLKRRAEASVGLLAGRGDGRVAGLVLAAQPDGADPAGDGPPAAGQDRAEEEPGQPGGGAGVEGRGESREPLARRRILVR